VANRLADASSPYLRQHADNPVDWGEWGEEAFAEARRRDVPIFLSVGYSSCHWCHVMAPDVAADLQLFPVSSASRPALFPATTLQFFPQSSHVGKLGRDESPQGATAGLRSPSSDYRGRLVHFAGGPPVRPAVSNPLT
jgi:hypothetical protein